MSQRRPDPTKWVWCVLVLSSGPAWSLVNGVAVRTPQKIPPIIEAQANFFQYRHMPTPEDFDQGHRLGNDRHFIERHERSRPAEGLFFAKVRWGDKKGGYGEHYWDLNHAGHAGNKEEEEEEYDDGDYNEELQDYPEPDEKSKTEREEYYPDASEYERSARPKRENSKFELQEQKSETSHKENQRKPLWDDFEKDMKRSNLQNRRINVNKRNGNLRHLNNNNMHLVNDRTVSNIDKNQLKAGLRNLHHVATAGLRRFNRQVDYKTVHRLFLESSKGHVIDRPGRRMFSDLYHLNGKSNLYKT